MAWKLRYNKIRWGQSGEASIHTHEYARIQEHQRPSAAQWIAVNQYLR